MSGNTLTLVNTFTITLVFFVESKVIVVWLIFLAIINFSPLEEYSGSETILYSGITGGLIDCPRLIVFSLWYINYLWHII
jgi:hypothetical protein